MQNRCEDVRQARSLVADPVNDFYSEMNDQILTCTYEFLLDQGLDLQLIKSCVVGSSSMKELILLKKMESILKKYVQCPPEELCERIRALAGERVAKFLGGVDTDLVFPVGLLSSLTQLGEFDFTNYVRAVISQVRFVGDDGGGDGGGGGFFSVLFILGEHWRGC